MALGGKKWMYAHTYYTEAEFWKIYDKPWYEALRKKHKATNLPTMYDKVVVREKYEVNARRGLLRTIAGTAKLRITK
jgi:delta24-sterol reductase